MQNKSKEPSAQTLSLEKIVERIQAYAPQSNVSLLAKAYTFSSKAHEGQRRVSGEPYLHHPLEVA